MRDMITRSMSAFAALAFAAIASLTVSAPVIAQSTNLPASGAIDRAVIKEALPELKFNVYRPRDLMARKKPAPVIAWGNGGCMKFDFMSAALVQRWAAAGYVVVTFNDPEAMSALPGAGGAPSAPPGSAGSRPSTMPNMAALSAGVDAQTASQVRMLDWAEQANAKGGIYAGKLDTKRMVVAGNSCGGITAVNASWRDPRPKSIFIVSGAANMPNVTEERRKTDAGRIAIPVLYIVGGAEDIARKPVEAEYAALRSSLPAVLVRRSSGDHLKISNDPAVQVEEAAIGLNWFKATLYGDRAAARELAARGCAACDPAVWSVENRNFSAR